MHNHRHLSCFEYLISSKDPLHYSWVVNWWFHSPHWCINHKSCPLFYFRNWAPFWNHNRAQWSSSKMEVYWTGTETTQSWPTYYCCWRKICYWLPYRHAGAVAESKLWCGQVWEAIVADASRGSQEVSWRTKCCSSSKDLWKSFIYSYLEKFRTVVALVIGASLSEPLLINVPV